MEVALRCKNDVCVVALSVNFTILMLHFMWFVSHFTVGVRGYYYCIAFHCWLLINGTVISFRERERERKETRNEINLRADLFRGPSITSLSSYGAKVRAGAKKMEGEGEWRRGNACPQTP